MLSNIAGALVSDSDDGLTPGVTPVAELAADPEAPGWARHCGWVPGTGYCRNRRCGPACVFRSQREAEARRIGRSRQLRRRAHRRFVNRLVQPALLLLLLA